MREYSTPLATDIPPSGNLTDDVITNSTYYAGAVVMMRRTHDAAPWGAVSAAQFHREVAAVAQGLIAAGIQPGDRIALLSRTRYEWTLIDYAIWFAGAVSVPIYETSAADQIEWILQDSQARAIFVETAAHRAHTASIDEVWTIDDGALAALTEMGATISEATLERRRRIASPTDVATLIYTSGTTGHPKGCMLTHGNLMIEVSLITHALDALFAADQAATLIFLPLAHVFARILEVSCIKHRVRMGHSSDIPGLIEELQRYQPTFILGVPRVFEKIFNRSSQLETADGHGRRFDRATDTAIAWSQGLDRGRVPLAVRARHAAYSRPVYATVRSALGGKCEYAVCGGAPLGERLSHFYRGIGVRVLEGYGLTETTAALTQNLPETHKIGTVGRPLPGTAVRVADDGELLFRGGQVFAGYWQDQEATDRVLEADGWFHSGDVGEVDDEGFVRVTGRKREILVTAGGKNVAPTVLEERVRAHPLVDQCLVVGDGEPFVAALITLDREALAFWSGPRQKPSIPAAAVRDPDVRAEIQRAVDEANKAVSKAESIRKFQVLAQDWTEEGGQLTPSLKLKRRVVLHEQREEIAALYA